MGLQGVHWINRFAAFGNFMLNKPQSYHAEKHNIRMTVYKSLYDILHCILSYLCEARKNTKTTTEILNYVEKIFSDSTRGQDQITGSHCLDSSGISKIRLI